MKAPSPLSASPLPSAPGHAGEALHRIGVIGAGAWGTALAIAFARAGRTVTLWGRNPEQMHRMRSTGQASEALGGLVLPPALTLTADLADIAALQALVVAVPTQNLREVATAMAPHLSGGFEGRFGTIPILSAAKGIERGSGAFVTDILRESIENGRGNEGGRAASLPTIGQYGLLSGPSFAIDVARGLPTAIVLAMADEAQSRALALALSSPQLRLYASTDIAGVQIGGAAKNVLAIAAGIVMGKGLGESARAAIIARGFAETRRYALAHGALGETLMGLSGMGDLVLSAASLQSRNYALGFALGQGQSLADVLAGGKLAEGAFTAEILARTAQQQGIDMPVVQAVAAVLAQTQDIDTAIRLLLARPLKHEQE